ncbi:MAG: gamma-glutamyl-gamma-aminobutyrate hydrolase family protein [Pyrinomonadaceae bacterium]
MADRPLIGITMRLELATGRFYLGRRYCEAIYAEGGSPVHIPLIPDATLIEDIVSRLDGILLPGCDSDPDPVLYGEDPHPKLGPVVPEKDATDLLVIAAAEKRGIPIFGICFGMQILNVSRGGSLIQDIGSQVEGAIKHDQGIPLERNSHKIRIENGSLMADLAGSDEISVNSHHHQAVKAPGKGMKATSWASDGVIESIEDAEGRPVFAVQWHPELSYGKDAFSTSLFHKFIKNCGKVKVKVQH